MKRMLIPVIGFLALGGCAHQELKAPCDPIASIGLVDGCGPERSINVATLDDGTGINGES